MMVMKRPSLCQFSWLLGGSLLLGALFWLWLAVQQQEATLAIRPVGQGIGMPDGFSVWHHLDANGIRFKILSLGNKTIGKVRAEKIKEETKGEKEQCQDIQNSQI